MDYRVEVIDGDARIRGKREANYSSRGLARRVARMLTGQVGGIIEIWASDDTGEYMLARAVDGKISEV